MDIRQLELFLAVMESSGVRRAAQRVHLSPGAVSMQIRKLSADVGADLFVRAGRRLEPTPTALRLNERARAIVSQMQQIESDFKADATNDTRPFYLSSTAVTLANRLGKALRGMRQTFPKCDLRASVGVTEEIVTSLLEHRIDLGLVSLPISTDRLMVMPLFEEELFLLMPTTVRAGPGRISSVRPEDLAGKPFLLYPEDSHVGKMIRDFLKSLGVSPRVPVVSSDTEVLKRLVESGLGCSVLPSQALQNEPRLFRIHRIGKKRLIRTQALVMAQTDFPRRLTISVANYLQEAMRG